jgi:transcriptional regulator with XRE-family HTH domain
MDNTGAKVVNFFDRPTEVQDSKGKTAMTEASTIGTRIRERRVMAGLRQSELARRAGISPSYLNLIEHNRRRIGGKTLNTLAEVLDVAPTLLSEGAEAALVTALREAAAVRPEIEAELSRTEEFAGRFPGWAELLSELNRQRDELEDTVKTLSDWLSHDPQLAASLHEVISTVTAIRSAASILADSQTLEPEWRHRFQRNITEDSRRLGEGAEALTRYLDVSLDAKAEIKSPQDEMYAFLAENGFHFPALENGAGADKIEAVLEDAETLETRAARRLARRALDQYVRDARALPLEMMTGLIGADPVDPQRIAAGAGADMAVVFRRLAALPEAVAGPVGLVVCDGSGTLVFRKPALGFSIPKSASACTLWPLFQLLSQPNAPVRMRLQQGETRVLAMAVSELVAPAGFDTPMLVRPHMLLLPDPGPDSAGPAREVGTNCRVCPMENCPARREPSILGAF